MNVLILTGNFGMGHVSAAKAIEEEIKKEYEESHVCVLDLVEFMLPYTNRAVYGGFNLLASRYHRLYNALNRIDDYVPSLPLQNQFTERFKELLGIYSPDLLISTWPVGSRYIGAYKRITGDAIPYITCITDISSHSEWLSEATSAYMVGDERSKLEMCKKGVDEEKIFVGGVPVGQRFKNCGYSAENEKKEVLIMGGGLGLIPGAEEMLAWFEEESDVHVTVITGHNEKLRKALQGRFKNTDVLGYSKNIDLHMKKADIIISKAGGITMFEAIHTETPIFVPKPFLEQEKNNAEYIERMGIGKVIGRKGDLRQEICDILFRDESELASMRERMRNIKREIDGNGVTEVIKSIGMVA